MRSTALYQWSVAGSPVIILVDLDLVDKLAAAARVGSAEIGGILTGSFDDNYTVINGFELLECEHRRGPAYSLSATDEKRLAARLASLGRDRKAPSSGTTPVGYFRSHLRPGLFLDEADSRTAGDFFHSPNQVVLLIRPNAEEAATGGFFFWEDGGMNRKQSYLPFPMSSRDLETNDFPLVTPAAASAAETLDTVELYPPPVTLPADTMPPGPAARTGTGKKSNWPLIGLIAAGAAFGGYLLGTSHHGGADRRPGDIYLYPGADPAAPASAPETQPSAASTPASAPRPTAAESDKPTPIPGEAVAVRTPAKPKPTPHSAPQVLPAEPTPAANTLAVNPNPVDTPVAAGEIAEAKPAPAPVAVRAAPPSDPRAETSISLEAAEDHGLRRMASKVPLFGYFARGKVKAGEDFVPAKALHRQTPAVPPGLARELTGPLPVDLKLTIDKNGRVAGVQLLSTKSDPEFVRLAGDAAYDFQFEPARLKDKPVSSDVIAHFRFRPAL